MNTTQLNPHVKLRYLCVALSTLWLAGCNGASTTPSSTTNPAPYITFVPNNLGTGESVALGGSFSVTAILTPNGNNVSNQTIESFSLEPNSESIIFTPNSCPVSSSNGHESCTITVHVESSATATNYTLRMQNATNPQFILHNESIPFSVIPPPPCNPCKLFITNRSYTTNLQGVFGADGICQESAIESGLTGTYKAFITDGVNRYACTTPNCGGGGISENKNWVLHLNTKYIWATNESELWTTNESAIYPFGKLKSRTQYYGTGTGILTGFGNQKNWTSPNANNCNQWFGATSGNVNVGIFNSSQNPSQTTSSPAAQNVLQSFSTLNCSSGGQPLLCVQQ